MAKAKETAMKRAAATVSLARRKASQLATGLARTPPVKKAGKSIARMQRRAKEAAAKVTDKITGRARKRKQAKVAAAIVGAVVATAASIGVARKRRR